MFKILLSWKAIFLYLLSSLFIFFIVYVWISMSTSLCAYAIYAGGMQALDDYRKGHLCLYQKIETNRKRPPAETDDNLFDIREYSIHFIDIAGRYGTQNYANAYNARMKQLYETDTNENPFKTKAGTVKSGDQLDENSENRKPGQLPIK